MPGLHVVVADGYDSGGVYVADPATGGTNYYDWSTFMTFWNVMDGMGSRRPVLALSSPRAGTHLCRETASSVLSSTTAI